MGAVDWALAEKVAIRAAGREPFADSYHYRSLTDDFGELTSIAEDQVAAAIKHCWDANGYVIDPHTACGYHVLEELPAAPGTAARVLLSTASPYKFPRAVAGALRLFCPPDDFACMKVLEKATNTTAPVQLATLQEKPVLHTDVVDIDGMSAFVEQAASKL